MLLNEYGKAALNTAGGFDNRQEQLLCGALGLTGEAGEVADELKKELYHGHKFNPAKIAYELGDVLWYVVLTANALGYELEDIAALNIEKLNKRYKGGFSHEASINREENNV